MIIAAMLLAGGAGAVLSAQSPPPLETDPAVIAKALKSCDAGDLNQCYTYGRAMLALEHTAAETTMAYDRLEKACDGGVFFACYGSGFRYIEGSDVPINLAKARIFEEKGCNGGDDRACGVIKRLDNPPPSIARMTGLSPKAQGNINMAIYVAPDGAQKLSQYADSPSIANNKEWQSNLKAASCEMGDGKECNLAALGFVDVGEWNGLYAADLPRAIGLAERGCDVGDAVSCYLWGTFLKNPDGSLPDNSRKAYQRAIPGYKKSCDEGGGYYCHEVAWMNLQGIDEKVIYGGLNFQTTVDPYRKRGCELGYQQSCDANAQANTTLAQAEADEQARKQRIEQERIAQANKPADTYDYSVSPKCMNNSNRFESEIKDFERQAGNLVANKDKNFNLLFDKSANTNAFYSLQKGKCINLRNIRQQSANDSCAIETLRAMDEMISQVCN